MVSRQITIGFDKEVHVEIILRILETHFDHIEVGKGIQVNGLAENTIYVHNKERKNRVH
jgi:hypothetical protein